MNVKITFLLLPVILLSATVTHAAMKSVDFSFTFEGKRYSGNVDTPEGRVPKAMVVIVPGSGTTDFANNTWYSDLRRCFVDLGFSVCAWDKAGCGKSEGVFDSHQTVQSSAKEALAAITEVRNKQFSGCERVGLWGISRAGWICPLIIDEDPAIAFWISVSGVDASETFGYLLETNLRIEGQSDPYIRTIMDEWEYSNQAKATRDSYDKYVGATRSLYQDPFFMAVGGHLPSEEDFLRGRQRYEADKSLFDAKSGLRIYVPEFNALLKRINCPVLAIFGERDSQVNWKETLKLYTNTIDASSHGRLTIKTLPDCNHRASND